MIKFYFIMTTWAYCTYYIIFKDYKEVYWVLTEQSKGFDSVSLYILIFSPMRSSVIMCDLSKSIMQV